jgi:acetyl esterase/lipase
MPILIRTPLPPTDDRIPTPRARAAFQGGRRRPGSGALIGAARVAGRILACSALALSGAFFYRVSADLLGPGAFMLSIPKILATSLAPVIAVAGAAGAALGLIVGWSERRRFREVARRPTVGAAARLALGAPLIVLAGEIAAALAAGYVQRVTAPHDGFAQAFGADWQAAIPAERAATMLQRRWTWRLPDTPEPRWERDVPFWTIPGTGRTLLADVWQPPAGVRPSGLAFIYFHGGGYRAFDKDAGTRPMFRHLTAQGHVVMDVAYRLIPETDLAGMQGDVKRAVAWMKRHAARYGVDPGRVVLGGGSAGAHLALLAAYAPDHPRFTPADVRGEDLSVRGVIAYYGPGDNRPERQAAVRRGPIAAVAGRWLTRLLEAWSGATLPSDEELVAQLLGGPPEEQAERGREGSPITHVGPQSPPTLQFMGEHDVYVSAGGTIRELHDALRAAGAPSVYVELPQTDHAFDLFFPELSPATQTALHDVDRFLALMAAPVEWKAPVPAAARAQR